VDRPALNLSLAVVDHVLARAASFGVAWRGSRFETYRNEMIAQASPDRAFIESFRRDNARQRLSFEAASQLLQMILAETAWDRLDRARLKAALKIVVKGPPLDPGDDDLPRNTLAELVAAANFAGRFTVGLTASAEDVRLDHPVIGQGAVEAKRPKALKNILSNLNSVGRQLRDRAKDGSQYGVTVIGGDRIAALASQAHEAPTVEVADQAMKDIVSEIASAVLRSAVDPACSVAPPAVYATVILTGAILVREPLHMLSISHVVDFPLPGTVPEDIHEAFKPKPGGGPMSKYSVAEHTGPREPPAPTG
jgi:hypothetical protein